MTEDKVTPIHVAMSRVMADINAVAKDQTNQGLGFKFRSIDAAMNSVYPALVAHGVFFSPQVIDYSLEEGQNRWRRATVKVMYHFTGPAGDTHKVGPIVGEAADNSDKGISKAMTMALKTMLLQTFCIPTEDQAKEDPDRHTPQFEPGVEQEARPPTPTSTARPQESPGDSASGGSNTGPSPGDLTPKRGLLDALSELTFRVSEDELQKATKKVAKETGQPYSPGRTKFEKWEVQNLHKLVALLEDMTKEQV